MTPWLFVISDGYQTAGVSLDADGKHKPEYGRDNYDVRFDSNNHNISIATPIVLKREGDAALVRNP